MTNVKAEIKGNILTLTVDLSERHGPSASGKTTTIASTQGNQAMPLPNGKGMFSYGLNVYTKAVQS